jgi:hypothetical protein
MVKPKINGKFTVSDFRTMTAARLSALATLRRVALQLMVEPG